MTLPLVLSQPKIRTVGICLQCERLQFGTAERDFAGLPLTHRKVYCYGCGLIVVDSAGKCLSDCQRHHNRNWVKRLLSILGLSQ